jgi:hypothetical protein
MSDEELQEKQNGKKIPGKKQMLVLWTAVLTALGSTGIPKVIEMLETKPSTAQVQVMIAKQTEALTDELNDVIDALKVVEKAIADTDASEGTTRTAMIKLETRSEMVQDILHTCCTRSVDRVESTLTVVPEPSYAGTGMGALYSGGHSGTVTMTVRAPSKPDEGYEVEKEKKPFARLKKLPKFDQQKIQTQLQEE